HADIKEENEAYQIMNLNRIMSKKTWMLKQGLDPESEKTNFEDEEADEVYPPEPTGTTQPEPAGRVLTSIG
ncbi:MAG: hypothetical protein ACXABY_36625, partial [Candidatus Thorarchaeota archaeon]